MHVITKVEPGSGALLARNSYNPVFTTGRRSSTWTIRPDRKRDRVEFLGRNGSLRARPPWPARRLSGKVGAALDPCGRDPGAVRAGRRQEREIVFASAREKTRTTPGTWCIAFRGSAAARGALESVWHLLKRTLGTVQVETPDPAVNVLANGWLL